MFEWYERLKSSRKEKKLKLEEVCNKLHGTDHITVQSLIAYENGRSFPRIDTFMHLCEIYGVSADYILFGKESLCFPSYPTNDTLFCLFMLMYSGKIQYDENDTIIVKDYLLNKKLRALDIGSRNLELSSTESAEKLLKAISKLSKLN